MRIKTQDIADHCGVSRSTVSFVLNGKGHLIKPATREKVEAAVRELDYRPNEVARSMAKGRMDAVTLFHDARFGRSDLSREQLGATHDSLKAKGIRLNFAKLDEDDIRDDGSMPDAFRTISMDGMLLNFHSALGPKLEAYIAGLQLPAVWINTQRERDAVYPDDVRAGFDLTQHLIALGHRHIVYTDYKDSRTIVHYSRDARRQGYEEAMSSAGLIPVVHEGHSLDPQCDAIDFFRKILLSPASVQTAPTAIVTYSWIDAADYACRDLGLRVGKDVSLATFGDLPVIWGIPYTTAVIPRDKLGRRASDMLVDKLNQSNPLEPLPSQIIEAVVVPGHSTGPVSHGT